MSQHISEPDYYEALHNAITLHQAVPEDLVRTLFSICSKKKINKNDFFIRAGDSSRYMGLNLDGLFRYYYTDIRGNDSTKGFSIPGQFIISYTAIIQQRPSRFSIQALCDSTILQFEYQRFHAMMQNDLRWFPFTYKLLESVYLFKEFREQSLLLENASERYATFKKTFSGVEKAIKLSHVASYLGITPETLSRIRKNAK